MVRAILLGACIGLSVLSLSGKTLYPPDILYGHLGLLTGASSFSPGIPLPWPLLLAVALGFAMLYQRKQKQAALYGSVALLICSVAACWHLSRIHHVVPTGAILFLVIAIVLQMKDLLSEEPEAKLQPAYRVAAVPLAAVLLAATGFASKQPPDVSLNQIPSPDDAYWQNRNALRSGAGDTYLVIGRYHCGPSQQVLEMIHESADPGPATIHYLHYAPTRDNLESVAKRVQGVAGASHDSKSWKQQLEKDCQLTSAAKVRAAPLIYKKQGTDWVRLGTGEFISFLNLSTIRQKRDLS